MKRLFLFYFFYSVVSLAQMKIELPEPDGGHTDAIVIEKDGNLIQEYFARGYTKNTPHLSWSMAKTITGILIAQASLDYQFSLSDQVKNFIPDFKGEAKIIDVLQMSSGIEFSEDYFGLPVSSDVVKMLYLDGAGIGATEYVKSLPLRAGINPGDHFFYSSGDANLLMEILKNIIHNDLEYENYPWKRLFTPLGIEHATFERDRNQIFIGSSYLYMSAFDYLKIGKLIMNNGKWNGLQLIPEFYIKLLHTVSPGVEKKALDGSSQARAYSVQATTNLPIMSRKLEPEYKDLPLDSVLLLGHQGQMIISSPSEKMVVVRLAMDKGSSFKRSNFLSAVKDLVKTVSVNYQSAGDQRNPKLSSPDPAIKSSGKLHLLDLFKIPQLIRRYTAKEYCSCRFVVGRSDVDCTQDVGFSMPVMPQIKITDGEKPGTKIIKTHFRIGDENTAEFSGEKFGCRLTD